MRPMIMIMVVSSLRGEVVCAPGHSLDPRLFCLA